MSTQANIRTATPPTKRKRSTLLAIPWPLYVLACLLSVTFLFPLFWMATTSLKTMQQAYAFPPVWFPNPVMWDNYSKIFTELPFAIFTRNSILITILNTTGVVLASALVAFGF
jgi:multiple sugar transport system permease protein